MGMDAPSLSKIPDPTIVAEVIRLADAAAAERYEQRPVTHPRFDLDIACLFRRTSAREELLAYLRGLPEEIVAALYGVYRAGDLTRPEPAEAAERYRTSFSLAMRPIHRLHGAHDLAAKGSLSDGLRRGIENLGLRLEASRTDAASDNVPQTA